MAQHDVTNSQKKKKKKNRKSNLPIQVLLNVRFKANFFQKAKIKQQSSESLLHQANETNKTPRYIESVMS